MAANIFTGVTDNNWNTATNWSLGTVPTAIDTHLTTFDASSPNCTINVSANVNAIDFTLYTNTITLTNEINSYGNGTLGVSMIILGTGYLHFRSTSTLTSNGKEWPNELRFDDTITYTLADNWTINGDLTCVANTVVLNGNNLYLKKGCDVKISGIGTTTIHFIGTGTWKGISSNSVVLNTAGTVTFDTTSVGIANAKSLTKVAGTVVATGSTFIIGLNNCSLIDCSSINFNHLSARASTTINSDINVLGNFSSNFNIAWDGLFTVYVGGNFSVSNIQSGTATFAINSNCLLTTTGTLKNNLTIKSTATVTINGTFNYNSGILINEIGSNVTTTASTLNIDASSTLNTNGINWNNVTISTGTINLNSLLTVNGTLAVGSSGTVIFAGTHGFTCNTFSCITAGRTINYATGKTYLVTNSLIVTGSTGSKISFASTSAGALFNLQVGASQNVQNCNATWIDSSGGQTIYTSAGTLTNTTNWGIGSGNFFLMF